jgi:putative hydrolase of the HAD superfamily
MTSNTPCAHIDEISPGNNQLGPASYEKLYNTEFWVFDLDNTLYPAHCQLFTQIENNMTRFVMEFLKLDHDAAYHVQKKYFKDHGTTMNGLMLHHDMDPHHYLDYVHQIDLTGIPKNPTLNDILSDLPGKKVIFTNGSTNHARRVTEHLGIHKHFDDIFDIVDCRFIPKPEPSAYTSMIERFGIHPHKAIMVEDMAKNLRPAAGLGMTTVWLRSDNDWATEDFSTNFIHHIADDLTTWLAQLTRGLITT